MLNALDTSTTIILVHGAWADGSGWHKVAARLMRAGYRVVAAQIPLISLRDDVEALRRWMRRQSGPLLLVGHSYGGAVITAAAADEQNVKGLVYIAAIVPDTDETVGQVFTRLPPHALAPTLEPDPSGYIWMSEEGFRTAVAPNAMSEDSTWMTATQKPISVKCLSEPIGRAGWREKPSWFLIAEEDRMVSPETQRFTASRMRSVVVSRPVDHHPLISDPQAVSDLIQQAART